MNTVIVNIKKVAAVGAVFVSFIIILVAVISIYNSERRPVELELGLIPENIWNIPKLQSYEFIDRAIDRFEKQNPGIRIKYFKDISKSNYSEWLAQKILTGTQPDVFCVMPEDFNILASIGALENLDRFIKDDKRLDLNNIYESALKSGQYGRGQYAIPYEVIPTLILVNKSLLKQEGSDLPKRDWNWFDLFCICNSVTKDIDGDGKMDQFGIVGFNWQDAVWSNGQSLFDKNGEKAFFNKPEVAYAVKYATALNQLNLNLTGLDFESGKTVFRPLSFSRIRYLMKDKDQKKPPVNFEWTCIKMPKGPDGQAFSELQSLPLAISARTKHKNEAWEFLSFLIHDQDVQMNVLRYSYGLPVLKSVLKSEEADSMFSRYMDAGILNDIMEQAVPVYNFKKYNKSVDMADKEIFQFIKGDKDIDMELEKLNIKVGAFLKE